MFKHSFNGPAREKCLCERCVCLKQYVGPGISPHMEILFLL